jgi:acyl dehydratase
MTLYLEDLSVGQKFRSRAYLVTEEEIKAFAGQYDPQPFHLDEAAAQNSFFKGLAASGWHTAAITMRLLVESVDISGGLIGAGIEHLRWFKPVRPGDTLLLECEIITLRKSASNPEKGVVKVKHVVYNQHEESVEEFISTIIVPSNIVALKPTH